MLEQAILDRLEKRNAQIAQLQSTIQALERAADAEREQTRQQLEPLMEENKRLAEQIEIDEKVSRSSREHAEYQIASLNDEITKRDHELRAHEKELAESREEICSTREAATYFGMTDNESVVAFIKRKCVESENVMDDITRTETNLELVRRECEQLRREVSRESTREALTNAVAKLQEVTTEKDRMRLQLENVRDDLKQALVERDSLGSMAADRALEIRKLMDGHAEDMKAQAELLSKYESLLTKITDLGSYAMTLGRKEGEPLEMFMERQALRLAALEAKTGLSIDFQKMANDQVGEVASLKVK